MYSPFSLVILLCLTIIRSVTATDHNPEVTVETGLGSIEGRVVTVSGNNVVGKVYEFIGIPYATPPVGNLRFRKPEPVEAWTGTYQATKWSDICVQSLEFWNAFNISAGGDLAEDCLYLNIWTPELPTSNHPVTKAVMVFIHGGGFRGGSASQHMYYGAKLSSLGDVVLVTINYRLGILGFLNLGVEDSPGNQGLWDQRMALLWVRDHISNFGGDPNQVTIFGESAGSMSIGFQLLSPMSRGLFHRAIMQSGGPINLWLVSRPDKAHEAAMNYAMQQGCYSQTGDNKENTDSAKIIECLRQIDLRKILQAEEEYLKADFEAKHIIPTYGDEFVPHRKSTDLSEEHTAVDLLIGINSNEGSIFVMHYISQFQNAKNETNNAFTLEDAKSLFMKLLANDDNAYRFYFESVSDSSSEESLKQTVADAFGDAVISCSSVYFAEYFAKQQNPVYFYHFNHRHTNSPIEEWTGVVHGEEMQYIFLEPIIRDVVNTEVEIELARQMITGWTSFAKTGKPEFPGVDKWPLYSERNPVYVDLKPNLYTTGIGPRLSACNYWRCHLMRL